MNTSLYIRNVAHAYDLLPICSSEAVVAWQALANETQEHYNAIARCITIGRTSSPEPYPDAYAMLRDIANGHIWVSTANSEHPLWDEETNVQFRVVHDVLGHGSSGSSFSWEGEWRAYETHLAKTNHALAKLALYTEAVGQVAWRLQHGVFGTQKAALMPQWLQWAYNPRKEVC